MPDLLLELAAPRTAISRKSDSNPLIGTGPFRVTAWEPGRRLTLAAFDDYWGGRPYLDAVTIELRRRRVRADIFDIPLGPARRILPEGTRDLVVGAAQAGGICLARTPRPLLCRRWRWRSIARPSSTCSRSTAGEPAFGLLPQWLSGYAFLFQAPPDVARARQLALRCGLGTLTLSYPANDLFLRSVAERVALNARDAGITIQPTPASSGNLRLVEWPLESTDAAIGADEAAPD